LLEQYKNDLLTKKPVQYILHEAWFYKMKLYVDENVLIPRPETEELVSWILADIKTNESDNITLLDVGTGSGCLAIALKKNAPRTNITAIDISQRALAVAKKMHPPKTWKLLLCIAIFWTRRFGINFLYVIIS